MSDAIIGLPSLAAVGGIVIGVLFALLKWFAQRLLADIDARLRRIDEVERRLERITAEMPQHYQRRDDAIREYTAINAKLDRLYELLMKAIT